MLFKDKQLMDIHLRAIHKAICDLDAEEDQSFTWRLNCSLIDLIERIRGHILKKNNDQLVERQTMNQNKFFDPLEDVGPMETEI